MKLSLKTWINIVTFAALALVIIVGWHDIVAAFHKMLTLNLWVLLLVIPVQFMLFYAIAKIYYYAFKTMGQAVPMKTLLPAALELNFVNHVFPSGGVSGFSYLNLRLKHDNISPAKSTLAQLTRFIFFFITFIVWLLLALVFLAAENKANSFLILLATALTCSIIFVLLITVYVVGSPSRIKTVARLVTEFVNKVVHIVRPRKPALLKAERVEASFKELHEDYLLVRSNFNIMRFALLWAFIGNAADFGSIYVVMLAHGTWVNLGAVIIAFGVASTAGMIAVLPGGLGVYEPLMAAVLLSSGVPAALAVSATLVYRVGTLLLALGTGYALYHVTLNRHGIGRPERQ